MAKPLDPANVIPSLASLPGLLQQISDRDLLLNEILVHASSQGSVEFYCWLQQEMVPRIQQLRNKGEVDGSSNSR